MLALLLLSVTAQGAAAIPAAPSPPCYALITPCTAEYDPVCGSDGVTYSNECEAEKVCQLMMCTEEYAPVCGEDGVTYDNKCKAEAANACGFKSTPGECCKRDPDAACTKEYVPVCGSDGVTYGNKCEAEKMCQLSTPGKCCKLDKKPSRCARTTNKCNKRGNFRKKCQSSCAKHCEGNEAQDCPRNSAKRCDGNVDCTNPKNQKFCPQSCPTCVAFNCQTKEMWTEEKSEWCCVHEQICFPSPPPAPPP